MIGILFLVNAIIAISIALTTTMLQNHFNKIEKSLVIYNDVKIYKTQSEIEFIQQIIDRYKELDIAHKDSFDIEAMIQNVFYQYKIGKFKYNTVHNIAVRGKIIVWVILFIQIGLEIISPWPGGSEINFIYIVANITICLLVTVAHVFKGINDQKQQLFIRIKDYVINAYPMESKDQYYQKSIKQLLDKIHKLETELESWQNEVAPTEEAIVTMKEEDIKALLQKFDKNIN